MELEVEEYLEQECGWPCTPDGCPGHVTNVIISVSIGNVVLHTPWYHDISNFEPETHAELKKLVGE